MSHEIIIIEVGGDGLTAQASGDLTYEVHWKPPHTLTPAQVGNRVEKMLKKLAQMSEGTED